MVGSFRSRSVLRDMLTPRLCIRTLALGRSANEDWAVGIAESDRSRHSQEFVLTLNPCRIRLMPSRVGRANSEILLDPVSCPLWKGAMQLTCHRKSSLKS